MGLVVYRSLPGGGSPSTQREVRPLPGTVREPRRTPDSFSGLILGTVPWWRGLLTTDLTRVVTGDFWGKNRLLLTGRTKSTKSDRTDLDGELRPSPVFRLRKTVLTWIPGSFSYLS